MSTLTKQFTVVFQVEKLESECSQLQQELQDSKDQNELLEFRILELEVSSLPTLLFRSCILGFSVAENTETAWINCCSELVPFFSQITSDFVSNYRKNMDRKLQKLNILRSKIEKDIFIAGRNCQSVT